VARYRTLVAPDEELSVARSADPHRTGHQPSGRANSPADDREHVLLALQASAGNRAVARLMEHPADSAAAPVLPPVSHPESEDASLEEPEPLAEFNELSEEEASPPMATPAAAPAGTDIAEAAPPSAAPAAPFRITGPANLWWIDGFSPASYRVSAPLATNMPATGTFAWAVTGSITLSDPAVARPTVTTTGASTARRDATISVTRTAPGGTRQRASYRLTVLAPAALRHLSDVDAVDTTFGYVSHVHYRIVDQFGVTLPSAIPVNERFTAAPTADAAGMDWRRGAEGSVLAGPADWMDVIQGEASGHTPTPVGPTHANAGDAVYHWPGEWRVGSLSIGLGTRVATVTWQKYRGRARHM
jgi:hypothetical protein